MTNPDYRQLAAEAEQAALRLLHPSTNWGPYVPSAADVAQAQAHATLAVSYRMAAAQLHAPVQGDDR